MLKTQYIIHYRFTLGLHGSEGTIAERRTKQNWTVLLWWDYSNESQYRIWYNFKRVSMGLSVWRETSKKLTVCREKREKINRVS